MAVLPSDEELKSAMLEELRKPDLDWETTTKKTLRTTLSAKFGGVDLKVKKELLNGIVDAFLANNAHDDAEDNSAAPNGSAPATDTATASAQPAFLQPPDEASQPTEAFDLSQLSDSDIEDGAPPPRKTTPSASRARPKVQRKTTSSGRSSTAKRKSSKPQALPESNSAWSYNYEETDLDKRNKGKTAYNYEQELSPELAEFMGQSHATRSDVTKRIWAYCKEKELPKAKGKTKLDETLQTALGRKTISFTSLSKALSGKMKTYHKPEAVVVEEAYSDDDDGDDEVKPKAKRSKKASKSSGKKGGATGGFGKLNVLSPELADVVGVAEETRAQVVSKVWKYIRANDLQNPKDKRQIMCDAKLELVFKKKKVGMFEMNKYLSSHIFPAAS